MSRPLKQTIIAFIFILILTGIGVGIYFLIKPEPVITTVVDVPRDTISTVLTNYVISGTNKIDVVAKIKNPNNDYASNLFSYRFDAVDSKGNIIANKNGQSFILAGQSKYLVDANWEVKSNDIAKIDFRAENISWKKADSLKDPNLVIKEKTFENFNSRGVAGTASGFLVNESNYDFDKVIVVAVLYDNKDSIIGLNKTELRTVLSKEKRYVEFNWDKLFSVKVNRLEIEATTNTLDSDNILKTRSGNDERFLKLDE